MFKLFMQLRKNADGTYEEIRKRREYVPINVLKINRIRTEQVSQSASPVFLHADHVPYVIAKPHATIVAVIGQDPEKDLYFMQLARFGSEK